MLVICQEMTTTESTNNPFTVTYAYVHYRYIHAVPWTHRCIRNIPLRIGGIFIHQSVAPGVCPGKEGGSNCVELRRVINNLF